MNNKKQNVELLPSAQMAQNHLLAAAMGVTEGYCLIATKLGYVVKDFCVTGLRYIEKDRQNEPYYNWDMVYNLKYIESWDKIMPVCQLIKNKKDYPKPVLNGIESIVPYIEATKYISKGLLAMDLEKVFFGVLNYFIWEDSIIKVANSSS